MIKSLRPRRPEAPILLNQDTPANLVIGTGLLCQGVLGIVAGALNLKKQHSIGVTSLRRLVKRRLPFLKENVLSLIKYVCIF